MISKHIISTNSQKVLRFLLLRPGKLCYEREIARETGISYGSANSVLNQLCREKLLHKKSEGRMCYYSVNMDNPYIREFKVLINLLILEPLIKQLKMYAHRIVLYGSWASGTNTDKSDIDLFIVSSNEQKIRLIIDEWSFSKKINNKKIQAVIKSPAELLEKSGKKNVFMEQIEQGKLLWEREINEDNI